MKKGSERRHFTVKELRVVRADGQPAVIAGHAAVFDTLSVELWGFREKIQKGAFANTLNADVRALFNHDPNLVLGRTTNKTLSLREDEKGLFVEITPPDTQAARDAVALIERGDVTQMSFGFRTITDKWNTEDGETVRTLVEVELFDVSPVTFPAYPDTDVAVRSLEKWKAEQPAAIAAADDLDLRRRRLKLAEIDA